MRDRILRANNTPLQKIKSVRWISQVNDGPNLRFGSAIASCIEVEAYGSLSDAPAAGEVVTYQQIYDVDTDFQPLSGTTRTSTIGKFTAMPSVPGNGTFSFIAYDNLHKLDVDFSSRLKSLESSFPITIADLLDEIRSVSGVTYSATLTPMLGNMVNARLNYFYSDGITCRDILSALAELNGMFVRCNANGEIGISKFLVGGRYRTEWDFSDEYIICPTDTQTYRDHYNRVLTPVVYKENGANVSVYSAEPIGEVILRKSDGTIIYDHVPQYPAGTDIYEISNNIILDNIMDADYDSPFSRYNISVFILTNANDVLYDRDRSLFLRNAEVRIFPFMNPYDAGLITDFINTDGTRFRFPIMKMVVSASEVILSCSTTGNIYQSTQKYQTADQANVTLSARVEKNTAAIGELDSEIGDLSSLTTTDQSDVVSAINEVDGNVGDLSSLTTTDKDSLVDAVNELDSDKLDASEVGQTVDGIYAPGTYTVNMPFFGYVAGNNKTIDLYFIPAFHIRQTATNPQVTITALSQVYARVAGGGYLESSGADLTQYLTVVGTGQGHTPGQRYGGAIQARLTKTTAFLVNGGPTEVTTNSPICGIASLTIALTYT